MTLASRSANERGPALTLGLRPLGADLRFLAGRTSTSVPSAKALGFSRTTFPFLTLPRIVMARLRGFWGHVILAEFAVSEQCELCHSSTRSTYCFGQCASSL